MNPFEIIIDNKKYEYLESINYMNKNYISFFDDENIYIKEYFINNNQIELIDIENELFDKIKELMKI